MREYLVRRVTAVLQRLDWCDVLDFGSTTRRVSRSMLCCNAARVRAVILPFGVRVCESAGVLLSTALGCQAHYRRQSVT